MYATRALRTFRPTARVMRPVPNEEQSGTLTPIYRRSTPICVPNRHRTTSIGI
ncbi:hypothetical protein GQ53DRAFT_741655 [Thozetella sp. PMI_491]|nr:hypothetical protein GQ53DRAFT_741655 [Thozetella sp. PMI_491]